MAVMHRGGAEIYKGVEIYNWIVGSSRLGVVDQGRIPVPTEWRL